MKSLRMLALIGFPVAGLLMGATKCSWEESGGKVDPVSTPAPPPTVSTVMPLNGVKLLSTAIERGDDPRTFRQKSYTVGPESHLLMRLENLADHTKDIFISEKAQIYLQITLVGSGAETEARQTKMKVCPVTRNWMMLATWKNAHPFGKSGSWSLFGGDYETAECVAVDTAESKNSTRFNVTPWFVNYVRRGRNYGLLLMATETVEIIGDESGAYAPRVIWQEKI